MSNILNKIEQNVTLGSFLGQNNIIKDLYGNNSLSFYHWIRPDQAGGSYYDVEQDGLPISAQVIKDAKSNFENTYGTITENSSHLGYTNSNRGYEIYHVENDTHIGAIYVTPDSIQTYNNMVSNFEREWKNYQSALSRYYDAQDEYERKLDRWNEDMAKYNADPENVAHPRT